MGIHAHSFIHSLTKQCKKLLQEGKEGRGFKEKVKKDNINLKFGQTDRPTYRQSLWFIGKLHVQKEDSLKKYLDD